MAAPSSSKSQNVPPSQTLYITNLCDSIRKDDLRLALYTLFTTYGIVLDVNALKTKKMRGQAHISFRDIGTATLAMRACEGMKFFGKEMRIVYSKNKSDTIAKLDGTYRPLNVKGATEGAGSSSFVALPGQEKDGEKKETAELHGQKRRRDESEDEEDKDVEMEVDDDE